MNEDNFYDIIYRMYYSNFYSESVKESFTYTEDELNSYYEENSDQLDTYDYRYFYIAADEVDETEYEDDEEGPHRSSGRSNGCCKRKSRQLCQRYKI